MTPSQKLIDACKKFEGLRLFAYRCPAGVLTIGYGHTQGVKANDKISVSEAEMHLRNDLQNAGNQVEKILPFLSQGQYDALTDFVFNLGIGNLRKSTLLKYIREGKPDNEIQAQFLRWVYSGTKVLQGLVKRRNWEADRWSEKI